MYSPSEVGRQSLFNAAFVADNVLPNPTPVGFVTTRVLQPGESCDVSLVIRQTTDLSPAGLLGGYKATLPNVTYNVGAAPVVQCVAGDVGWVNASNLYGFGSARDLSTPEGVQTLIAWLGARAKAAGCKSVLIWQPQGGAQLAKDGVYSPRFDEFPAAVASNISALIAGLNGYGISTGVSASGYLVDINDPASVAAYLSRFKNLRALGFRGAFIDSFGGDYAAAVLASKIRAVVGPDFDLVAEFCSDATLPYARRYAEQSKAGLSWMDAERYSHLAYLFGADKWVVKTLDGTTTPAGATRLYADGELAAAGK